MKTDFKALVENAKLQVTGDEVLVEQDVFIKLDNVQATINLLEENYLDSTEVQITEMALTEQICLEFLDKFKAAAGAVAGKMGSAKGVFSKVVQTIVKFVHSTWDLLTMKSRDLLKELEDLNTKAQELVKEDGEPAVKASRNKLKTAISNANNAVKTWFSAVMPKYKKLSEDADKIKEGGSKDNLLVKQALKVVADLKRRTTEVTTLFGTAASSGRGGLNSKDSTTTMDVATNKINTALASIKKLTGPISLALNTAKVKVLNLAKNILYKGDFKNAATTSAKPDSAYD